MIYKSLMFDQGKNFYLISLSILIACWLNNVWILWGEVTYKSILGLEGLKTILRHKIYERM